MRSIVKLMCAVLSALVLAFAAAGCGGNPCQVAYDNNRAKNRECGLPEGPMWEEGYECREADGVRLTCTSTCYTNATCETLRGEDAAGVAALAACTADCNS